MRWTHKTKEDLITEIRHLKKELRVLEVNERAGEMPLSMASELEKTVENLNLIGIVLEENGTITFCNTFALKILGYTLEEMIGKNFLQYVAGSFTLAAIAAVVAWVVTYALVKSLKARRKTISY